MPPYKYAPDENPKRKHHWNKNIAGFAKGRGGQLVGKCPNKLPIAACEELLNNGIQYSSPRWEKPYPQNIFNILDGTVYRATHTVGGVSYHGFPAMPNELKRLPRDLKDQLLQLAEKKNCRQKIAQLL